MTTETILSRIRTSRIARGFTQQDMAKGVGLSRASIVNIEAGKQALSLEHFLSIARFLDIDPGVLAGPVPPAKGTCTTCFGPCSSVVNIQFSAMPFCENCLNTIMLQQAKWLVEQQSTPAPARDNRKGNE